MSYSQQGESTILPSFIYIVLHCTDPITSVAAYPVLLVSASYFLRIYRVVMFDQFRIYNLIISVQMRAKVVDGDIDRLDILFPRM
ncbi:uncharacterized protein BO88DRAFT_114769 [Aspergillus vadensis CBS 113365]|uniref:Uncharacterized protein n=1 Tax=Aspergillus vadensis (strain CBS 113365 / IMI 142717 / IBT 24658) TaxID=1448311 RepID=A0A319BKQ8_ASPVC|nr:hypothetical protein BO88DRAFT_114769 [Aspergillus vadensis CBS 113365]PYH66283.1 hypothetical protein BO88DRAFT_114769 [Aspergillus vadensis CBS 113365]